MQVETTTVTLGNRDYTIQTAPYVRSAPWRRRLVEEIKPLFDQAANVPNMTFETPEDLLKLWPMLTAILVDGIDTIFDMLISYTSVLGDDKEYIENHATEKQIMAAFQEVIRLSDPFGLAQLFARRTGLARYETGSKSLVQNGATIQEKQPT